MTYELVTLALLSLKGIGARTVGALWKRHPQMEGAQDVAKALGELKKVIASDVISEAFDKAHNLLGRCKREDIEVMGPDHPHFPPRLREIPDSPILLFAVGNTECLLRDSVAVIGTREPTDYGIRAARKMAKSLAEAGWVIVSGLAEGCDTAGHEGCLDGAGKTVAFLAHGFGRIYPASNKDLAERIVATGGCLVTEYQPGMPPTRGAFVERDRLQSGLSLAVIVIETDVKGGTMHTVRHAAEQHKPLAALSHPEKWNDEPKIQGNLMLIADGRATPLREKEDVFKFVEQTRCGGVPSVKKLPKERTEQSQEEFKIL